MNKPHNSPHNSPSTTPVHSQQHIPTLYVRESYRQSAGFTEFMAAMNANAIEANIISLEDRSEDTMSAPPKAMQSPSNVGGKTGVLLAIIAAIIAAIIVGLLVVGTL